MRITIESTDRVVELVTSTGSIPGRLWEGTTASGIAIQVLVTRIAVDHDEDTSQFEAELLEQRPPSNGMQAFPARLIL